MTEEFVTLARFPNYSISNLGRIRRDTSRTNAKAGTFLRPTILKKNGYSVLTLMDVGNKRVSRMVHQLVCEAFRGNPPDSSYQVAHYDGNPSNNRSENLRWVTNKENADDRDRHGRTPFGSKSYQAKLTENNIIEVLTLYFKGLTTGQICRQFLVSQSTICDVVAGRTWKRFRRQLMDEVAELKAKKGDD